MDDIIETMDELIRLLKDVDSGSKTIDQEDISSDKRGNIYIDDSEISYLANTLLITNTGRCNWDNIALVRKEGFDVFAGDQDSFGWLVGCIRTNKGIITYG